jgi:hypothetical protein
MGVALVALFVSLAGNAAAVTALVTSKQIKDKTIQLRDIAPAARASLRGQQGIQGDPGARGLRGPMGLGGPQGPAGKSFDPYTIENDLQSLCKGLKATQREIDGYDGINRALARYPVAWPYQANFQNSLCIYNY